MLAITNIMGSQATRDSDGVLFTRAGLEIGVAATKTFVAQVAVMYLRAALAQLRGTLEQEVTALCRELRQLPHRIDELVENVDDPIRAIAEHWKDAGFFLYLGRQWAVDLPRGRAQAQGDLLHPDRRLRGGRDEARADRPARRADAGGAWPPTRRCSTRCSRTSPRCGRAGRM